jgi:hypothetical protein
LCDGLVQCWHYSRSSPGHVNWSLAGVFTGYSTNRDRRKGQWEISKAGHVGCRSCNSCLLVCGMSDDEVPKTRRSTWHCEATDPHSSLKGATLGAARCLKCAKGAMSRRAASPSRTPDERFRVCNKYYLRKLEVHF